MTKPRYMRILLKAMALCSLLASTAGMASSRLDDIEQTLRGRPEDAIQAIDAALPQASPGDRVEMLVARGQLAVEAADDAAAEASAKALDAQAIQERSVLASASAQFLRAQTAALHGPHAKADRIMGEAMDRLPVTTPPSLRMRFLRARASIKQTLDHFDEELALYQEALVIADHQGIAWKRAEIRAVMALSLFRARQVDRALAVDHEAQAIARDAGDVLALSRAAASDAILLSLLGRSDEELKATHLAIDTARKVGAKRDAVLQLANLSDHYLRSHDYATALAVAREALPLAQSDHNWQGEVVARINAGFALISMGRQQEGLALVKVALRLETETGSLADVADLQQELGETLERAGQLPGALAAFTEYRRLADEVDRRDRRQAVLELEEGYDAARRREELAALRTQTGLQDAQLNSHILRQRLWAVIVALGLTVLAIVALSLRRVKRINAELSSVNSLLQVASERDPLTGLANRRHFLSVIPRLEQGTNGFKGSLLLIDIDHFKRINDAHGHAGGDAVLVELSKRLRMALREEDMAVRWGGEEFLVVLAAMPRDHVEALAERLLDVIGGTPVLLADTQLSVTASIGFATFPLAVAPSPLPWSRAIDLVDTAMYLAKAHGRNRAYGVRSLPNEGGDAVPGPEALNSAWETGQADLTQFRGPLFAAATP